jgi:hypothetical protein
MRTPINDDNNDNNDNNNDNDNDNTLKHTTVAGRIGDVERVRCCANRKRRARRQTGILHCRLISAIVGARWRCVRHRSAARALLVRDVVDVWRTRDHRIFVVFDGHVERTRIYIYDNNKTNQTPQLLCANKHTLHSTPLHSTPPPPPPPPPPHARYACSSIRPLTDNVALRIAQLERVARRAFRKRRV